MWTRSKGLMRLNSVLFQFFYRSDSMTFPFGNYGIKGMLSDINFLIALLQVKY